MFLLFPLDAIAIYTCLFIKIKLIRVKIESFLVGLLIYMLYEVCPFEELVSFAFLF